jgi:hypothetical protein
MCCAVAAMPPPDQVTPDAPLRLGVAAAIAFPDGSMTAAGLRREAAPTEQGAGVAKKTFDASKVPFRPHLRLRCC